MKSFPYFEFIVFIMPGGYFIVLFAYILGFHGKRHLIEFAEMSASAEVLFMVTLSMLIGHFLGWIANKGEKLLWQNKSYNNILTSSKGFVQEDMNHEDIFTNWGNLYHRLENKNLLESTITKLYAQARFAQNIFVANLLLLIINGILYLTKDPSLNYVYDPKVAFLFWFLSLSMIFCLILFYNRDRLKVLKVYFQGKNL